MKKILIFGILIVSMIGMLSVFVNAQNDDEFAEAKALISQNVSCSKLTNEQLEEIGEYYMEQMHPGESHELMHKMMGLEEGSDAEKQFHINMARNLYCNENVGGMMGSGMMGSGMMGSGMMGSGMMGSGMMGNQYSSGSYPMMGNMMGSGAFGWMFGWVYAVWIIVVLVIVILVLLIILLLKQLSSNKRRR